MTKKELVYLIGNFSYRDGMVKEEREYILFLGKKDMEDLFEELQSEYEALTISYEGGKKIELESGMTLVLPLTGKITINEGPEFKLFKRVPIILVPNIR